MARYCITGATGYIGWKLVEYLHQYDGRAEIAAVVRNADKAQKLFSDKAELIPADLTDEQLVNHLNGDFDYIIHCACVTKSAEMISHPVEVTRSIVNATQNVLELARRCKPKSMVFLSSMEVYGDIDCTDGHRVSEQEYGNIDLLNVRSCYSLGKRMAENICYSYFSEYGVPVKIARLAQTFGDELLPGENRVFAQFARSVKNGTDIVLHTDGSSMGNYCGIRDAVAGILKILEHGKDGEAYNVVNEMHTMTIRQMAEFVADEIANGKIKVVHEIPKDNEYGYAASTGLRLSGKKLMETGWTPRESLRDMFSEIISKL